MSAYSNYGMALAGYVVERASGLPFAAYVRERILVPLGMAHTTFEQPLPPSLAPLMAKSYSNKDAAPLPFVEVIHAAPAGALAATGADMGRFMLALFGGGTLDGQQVLAAATLARMMAPVVVDPDGQHGARVLREPRRRAAAARARRRHDDVQQPALAFTRAAPRPVRFVRRRRDRSRVERAAARGPAALRAGGGGRRGLGGGREGGGRGNRGPGRAGRRPCRGQCRGRVSGHPPRRLDVRALRRAPVADHHPRQRRRDPDRRGGAAVREGEAAAARPAGGGDLSRREGARAGLHARP